MTALRMASPVTARPDRAKALCASIRVRRTGSGHLSPAAPHERPPSSDRRSTNSPNMSCRPMGSDRVCDKVVCPTGHTVNRIALRRPNLPSDVAAVEAGDVVHVLDVDGVDRGAAARLERSKMVA